MTLLAVRQFFGTPLLIADVLVSSKAPRKHRRKYHFPTRPPHEILYPTPGYKLLPSKISRKIYTISDNFAIGFAGDLLPAADLLTRIWSTFAGRTIAENDWANFITSQLPPSRNVTLLGWIVESNRSVAFRWQSKCPSRLETDTSRGASFTDGSGAEFAPHSFDEPVAYKTTAKENSDKATLCTLDLIAEHIAYEFLDGRNLDHLFGLCYEAIIFDGNMFSYIDDVNYLFFRYAWQADRPDRIEGGLTRYSIHYKNFGDYACCTLLNHAYDPSPHVNRALLIKPIYTEKSQEDWSPSRFLHQGFDADYFCNFFQVLASDGKHMLFQLVLPRGSPDLPIELSDEGAETYVKMKDSHRDFILQQYLRYRAGIL